MAENEIGDTTIEWVEPERNNGRIVVSIIVKRGAYMGDIETYLKDYHDSEEQWDGEEPRIHIVRYNHMPKDVEVLEIEYIDDWVIKFEELEHIRNMAILLSNNKT